MKRINASFIWGLLALFFVSTAWCEEQSEAQQPRDKVEKQEQEIQDLSKEAEAKSEEQQEAQQLRDRLEKLEEEMRALRLEAEARKKLAVTEEEKTGEERAEEILKASAQRYILLKKGHLELEFNSGYSYYADDQITPLGRIQHSKEHTITNTVGVTYGLLDNLSLNARFPFVYKYEKFTGEETSDIGDVSFGVECQPVKGRPRWPSMVFYGTFKTDTGRSSHDINLNSELSTGSGNYSIRGGVNLNKTIDPLVTFGGLSYTYQFEEDGLSQRQGSDRILEKVALGDTITYNIGLGYSMSYKVSFVAQFQQSYSFKTDYWLDTGKASGTPENSAMLVLGSGFRLTRKTLFYVNVGIGLTEDSPDFLVSLRLPLEFSLF